MLKYGRVLRGPELMSPSEFNDAQRAAERKMLSPESLRKLSFKLLGKEPPPPAMGIGFKTTEWRKLMRIPARKEAQHFQIMGDTGIGKTQLIMQILRQIRDRGDSAIVYDPACEFVQRFYDKERGDIVLNPLDARCPFWRPAHEMDRNAEAVTIAASLYQPTTDVKDEFFHQTPAQIFAHLLKNGPTPHRACGVDGRQPKLEKLVAGTEMSHYINRKAGPQRTGVLASLGSGGAKLPSSARQEDATATCGTRRTGRRSARVGSSLRRRPPERETLRPLHSLWIDLLVMRLLSARSRDRSRYGL